MEKDSHVRRGAWIGQDLRRETLGKLYSPSCTISCMSEMPISDSRERLGEVVGRARYAGEEPILTHYGSPAAIVISFEDTSGSSMPAITVGLPQPAEITAQISEGRQHREAVSPARAGLPRRALMATSSSTRSPRRPTPRWRRPAGGCCSMRSMMRSMPWKQSRAARQAAAPSAAACGAFRSATGPTTG